MDVTELGMVTLVNEVHCSKAKFPMDMTELGMVTLVSEEQLRKALFPMEVTELGIIVFLQPTKRVLVAVLIMALQSFLLS